MLCLFTVRRARRRGAERADRPFGSQICSEVLCSTSSMEEGASARPHSPRQRTCSRTDCLCVPLAHTGIHLIGRRRDDHHHVRSPPWPPPPRATAAETAAATPHRIALHRIETGVAWAVTRVLVHRAALLKRSGMGANAASWHSLSPSLMLKCVLVCHAVIRLCVQFDVCAVCARETRAISIFRSRHTTENRFILFDRDLRVWHMIP